eukprot:2386643-Pleurochrysis_carterae.AAC.1
MGSSWPSTPAMIPLILYYVYLTLYNTDLQAGEPQQQNWTIAALKVTSLPAADGGAALWKSPCQGEIKPCSSQLRAYSHPLRARLLGHGAHPPLHEACPPLCGARTPFRRART